MHWLLQRRERYAGYVSVDIKAAFPSLIHSALFFVLHHMGFPMTFINALKKLYKDIWVQVSFRGSSDHGYWLGRGIKQGCPLSGSLFALAFDPILRMLLLRVPRQVAEFGAFADDVGAACRNVFQALRPMMQVWVLAAGAFGLVIHLGKTRLRYLGESMATSSLPSFVLFVL